MTTTMETSSRVLETASIPTLAHLLAGGELLASQQPRACLWSAEKSLAAAVLAGALIEIRDHSGHPRRAAQVAEEMAWLRAEADDHLYTFRRLCELLNLDPQWVREVAERWHTENRRRRAPLNWRVAA